MAEHVPVNFSASLTSRSTSGCIVLIPVKTGGRLVKHARYYWLMLAESHLTRRPFGGMVRRIGALAVATGETEAMSTAKSGDQGVMAGDVFVEYTENTGFPGFGVCGQGEIGAWR